MTQEKKCFISPEDISAVRICCKKCKAASIVPAERLLQPGAISTQISGECPYCHEPSGFRSGTKEFAQLVDFASLLGNLTGIMQGRNIQFSFQVECSD